MSVTRASQREALEDMLMGEDLTTPLALEGNTKSDATSHIEQAQLERDVALARFEDIEGMKKAVERLRIMRLEVERVRIDLTPNAEGHWSPPHNSNAESWQGPTAR